MSQAVFELGDVRERLEDKLEDLTRFPVFLGSLEEGAEGNYQATREGADASGREDLPFTDLVVRFCEGIPIHSPLKQINETHRNGLETDE